MYTEVYDELQLQGTLLFRCYFLLKRGFIIIFIFYFFINYTDLLLSLQDKVDMTDMAFAPNSYTLNIA